MRIRWKWLLMVLFLGLSGCTSKEPVIQLEGGQEELPTETKKEAPQTNTQVAESTDAKDLPEPEADRIYVYVCGQVNQPGVYELAPGSRVFEAVEMADGFTGEACQKAVNLALQLEDGQQLLIPSEEEVRSNQDQPLVNQAATAEATTAADGKININQADSSQLMELNGIGEAKALAIIRYREANGPFQKIDELKNVDGIGDKIYEKIKEDLTLD